MSNGRRHEVPSRKESKFRKYKTMFQFLAVSGPRNSEGERGIGEVGRAAIKFPKF